MGFASGHGKNLYFSAKDMNAPDGKDQYRPSSSVMGVLVFGEKENFLFWLGHVQ